MKQQGSRERILPRGRVAGWSAEQIEKLTTLELRALLDNARRLNEPEVVEMCTLILDKRPRGHARAPQRKGERGLAARLVTRRKGFEMHGVSLRNRLWSRGGIKTDGAVLLAVPASEVSEADGTRACLLWGPNVDASRPWSDTPGGQERLEHCRVALERGGALGLLLYDTPGEGVDAQFSTKSRIDGDTLLSLQIEKRGEEYWASWTPEKRATTVVHR